MTDKAIEGRITDISETESGVLLTVYIDADVPALDGYDKMSR